MQVKFFPEFKIIICLFQDVKCVFKSVNQYFPFVSIRVRQSLPITGNI